MSETLERLARIIDPLAFSPYYRFDRMDVQRSEAIGKARRVLQELREPDEAMLAASAKHVFQPGRSWTKCACDVWQAGIDHLLGDPQP